MAHIDFATIWWDHEVLTPDQLAGTERPAFNNRGFYCILGARADHHEKCWRDLDLLYIGQAYRQTIRDRVLQEHAAYECVNEYLRQAQDKNIVVMAGIVVDASLDRITQEFFDDIECCLIYSNDPLCNTACAESYSGRPLFVVNEGDYSPLRKRSSCF